MITIDNIKDFIGNKKVVLIGNSESGTEKDYTDFIKVRMNLGIYEPCDIWVNNLSANAFNEIKNLPNIYPKLIVRLNAEDNETRLHHFPDYLKPYTYKWRFTPYHKMRGDLELEMPTTGMSSVYWFYTYEVCKLPIYLDRYDFFKTLNRHHKRRFGGKNHGSRHNPEREKKIIEEYHQQGIVKWIS